MSVDPYSTLRDAYTRAEERVYELQKRLVWIDDPDEYELLADELRRAEASLEVIRDAGIVRGVWLPGQNEWKRNRFASRFH